MQNSIPAATQAGTSTNAISALGDRAYACEMLTAAVGDRCIKIVEAAIPLRVKLLASAFAAE
jgi:hypothetical protein